VTRITDLLKRDAIQQSHQKASVIIAVSVLLITLIYRVFFSKLFMQKPSDSSFFFFSKNPFRSFNLYVSDSNFRSIVRSRTIIDTIIAFGKIYISDPLFAKSTNRGIASTGLVLVFVIYNPSISIQIITGLEGAFDTRVSYV